jgi:glycosyltransferase involved in cell wall biosynthesis
MRFSIITPCFNRVTLVSATIESVIAQDYSDFEHWIVDAGSTDGTLDVLKRYPHLRVISEPDRGVYDAINKGLRLATGEILILLNSDDLLVPGALSLSADIFQNAVGTMIVSAGCQIFRCGPDGTEIEMHRYDNPRLYALSLRNVTVGLPNINARFFRRKVFDQIGNFDLTYPIAADRDFLIRAALNRLPDAPIAKVLYRYRWHSGSLTMNSGNQTLMAAMRDNEGIVRRYSSFPGLLSVDLANLRALEERSVATGLMILVLNGDLISFSKILLARIVSRPSFLIVFLRCGTAAIFRRMKVWTQFRISR